MAGGSKKRTFIRRLLFSLVAVFLLAASFLYGFWIARTERPPYKQVVIASFAIRHSDFAKAPLLWLRQRGRWSRGVGQPPDPEGQDSLSRMQDEEIRKLEALGYLRGTKEARGESGVRLHDVDRAYQGLNLYTTGLRPEAILMDMEGRKLHRWRLPFAAAFPQVTAPADATGVHYWRRVFLYPNGDLLAIYENLGLIKIDRQSRLLWALYNQSHHDLEVLDNGDIHVLTLDRHVVPSVHGWRPIVEDFITVVSDEGVELRSSSLIEAIQQSHYSSLLQFSKGYGDLLHTNTLAILDGSHAERFPHFRRGMALVSFNTIDTIALVDLVRNEVVWARNGMWRHQHDPRLLGNGNFLLFDNLGNRGFSKVIEFDPLTDEVVWGYYGDAGNGFFSSVCGASQRMPNGNTVITETDAGRVFEVTPQGEIVWEFVNPDRVGRADELIASVFELIRLDRDEVSRWLPARSEQDRRRGG